MWITHGKASLAPQTKLSIADLRSTLSIELCHRLYSCVSSALTEFSSLSSSPHSASKPPANTDAAAVAAAFQCAIHHCTLTLLLSPPISLSVSFTATTAEFDGTKLFAATNLRAELHGDDPFGHSLPVVETLSASFVSVGAREELAISSAMVNLTPEAISALQHAATIPEAKSAITSAILLRNATGEKLTLEWDLRESLGEVMHTCVLVPGESARVAAEDPENTWLSLAGEDKSKVSARCRVWLALHETLVDTLLGQESFRMKSVDFVASQGEARRELLCLVRKEPFTVTLMEGCCCYQSISPQTRLYLSGNTSISLPYYHSGPKFDLQAFLGKTESDLVSASPKSLSHDGSLTLVLDSEKQLRFNIPNAGKVGVARLADDISVLWERQPATKEIPLEILQLAAPCTIRNELTQQLEVILSDATSSTAEQGKTVAIFASPEKFSNTTMQFRVKFHGGKFVYESQQYFLERLSAVTTEGRYIPLKAKDNPDLYAYIVRQTYSELGLGLSLVPCTVVENACSFVLAVSGQRLSPGSALSFLSDSSSDRTAPLYLGIYGGHDAVEFDPYIAQQQGKVGFSILSVTDGSDPAGTIWLLAGSERGRTFSTIRVRDLVSVENGMAERTDLTINGVRLGSGEKAALQIMSSPQPPVPVGSAEEARKLLTGSKDTDPVRLEIESATGGMFRCVISLRDLLEMQTMDVFSAEHDACVNLEATTHQRNSTIQVMIREQRNPAFTLYGLRNLTEGTITVLHPSRAKLSSDLVLRPHSEMYLSSTEFPDHILDVKVAETEKKIDFRLPDRAGPIGEFVLAEVHRTPGGGSVVFRERDASRKDTAIHAGKSFTVTVASLGVRLYPFRISLAPMKFMLISASDLTYSVHQEQGPDSEGTTAHYAHLDELTVQNNFSGSVYTKENLEFIRRGTSTTGAELTCEILHTGRMEFIKSLTLRVPTMKLCVDDSLLGFVMQFTEKLTPAGAPADNGGDSYYYSIGRLLISPVAVVLHNRVSTGAYIPIDGAELRIEEFDRAYQKATMDMIFQDLFAMVRSVDWKNIGKVLAHSSLFGNISSAFGELKKSFSASVSESELVLPELILSVPRIVLKNVLSAGVTIGKNIWGFAAESESFEHREVSRAVAIEASKSCAAIRFWVNSRSHLG